MDFKYFRSSPNSKQTLLNEPLTIVTPVQASLTDSIECPWKVSEELIGAMGFMLGTGETWCGNSRVGTRTLVSYPNPAHTSWEIEWLRMSPCDILFFKYPIAIAFNLCTYSLCIYIIFVWTCRFPRRSSKVWHPPLQFLVMAEAMSKRHMYINRDSISCVPSRDIEDHELKAESLVVFHSKSHPVSRSVPRCVMWVDSVADLRGRAATLVIVAQDTLFSSHQHLKRALNILNSSLH